MIDFYYWPTPNGWKVSILLEELGLPYNLKMVNIVKGDQFEPSFLAISPNNRMPAIVDNEVEGPPISVFESGAILHYLATKHGRFMPTDPREQIQSLEWLFWQTGNQGPMAGQHSHFFNYAPAECLKKGYAFNRYTRETTRCLSILDQKLAGQDWIVGANYSIVDMMCWPWVLIAKAMGLSLDNFPHLLAWRLRVKERPAVQRGVALGKLSSSQKLHDAQAKKILFGQ